MLSLGGKPHARCRTRLARDERRRPRAHWLATGPLLMLILGVGYVWSQTFDFYTIRDLRAGGGQPEITLLDYEGVAFARLGGGRGAYLRLDQMSPWLPAAVVAIEDHRFYRHPGIDVVGIARAMVKNILAGRVVEGGSTISQQLAKLSYVGPERSLGRKLREALYALVLETRFSKDQILEAYLNKVYLGGGAYGVDAAARRYFAKPAKALTLAEAAMLAGLIKAPSRYAPTRALASAQARAKVVLARMVDAGLIDDARAEAAIAEPAVLAPPKRDGELGYFIDWVTAESHLYSSADRRRLTVQTTLDRGLQRHAEQAVKRIFERYAADFNVRQVGLVAMTPDGRVKAMLGGRAYGKSQFNRAVHARRQPGSAFKLFLYLAALDAGIYPDDHISARPIEVDGWRPRNADDAYPRNVSIAYAFSHSVNTAAVRLAERIGRDQIVAKARQLGITTALHQHPSLALGSAEVTLLELTAAYATVANGGMMVWPEGITTVTDGRQETLYRRQALNERVLTPKAVDGMTAMLMDTLVDGTGWRARLPGFVAGKTGTSSDYRDAWFVGFTDHLVVGVWVGNDDGQPMQQVSGGGLPAMIFRDFVMRSGSQSPSPADRAPGLPIAQPENRPAAPSAAGRLDDRIGQIFGTIWEFLRG